MDITEQVLFQHHQLPRMFALLDEIDPGDADALEAVWRQLAIFLEVHAEAEEQLFYPAVLRAGNGAGGAESTAGETEDALSDRNDIRDAVAWANKEQPGTDAWRKAVIDARVANSDHMAEEERKDLADFRRHADLATRHELAAKFLVLEAQHAGGLNSSDKDPQDYVAEHK